MTNDQFYCIVLSPDRRRIRFGRRFGCVSFFGFLFENPCRDQGQYVWAGFHGLGNSSLLGNILRMGKGVRGSLISLCNVAYRSSSAFSIRTLHSGVQVAF